jgi:hypothetical protein
VRTGISVQLSILVSVVDRFKKVAHSSSLLLLENKEEVMLLRLKCGVGGNKRLDIV